MKNTLTVIVLASLFLATFACKKADDTAQKIAKLEQEYAATKTPEKAKALVIAYRDAAKIKTTEPAAAYRYLTQAADIQFTTFDDAVAACRWMEDALAHFAAGQNLTDAIGTYAAIWNTYIYKAAPAVRLDPDDIDKMRASLIKHAVWMDSNLVRLDKKIMANPADVDKASAKKFIDIAEAYADIAAAKNPDKAVDLLMKAGGMAKTVGNFNKAISLYFTIQQRFPEHKQAPTAAFLMAFVYDDDLKDMAKAKAAYEDYLKKYPNDQYAADAKILLEKLGKSPEEWIKEMEKKQGK